MKYSILSIFRAKQKMTLRPSRKHCSLLCVFVMKEYLLNCSSIRLDYDLLVFSSRFLLPKMKVFDIWKEELSNFHELLESARARASFENWFCVESRVTAFTGKKNQVKRLLSRWSTTLFRCTCLHGHWIKEFFKELLCFVSMDIPWCAHLGKVSPFRRVCHLTTNAFVRSIHNRFVSLTRNCGFA